MIVFILVSAVFFTCLGAGLAFTFGSRVASHEERQAGRDTRNRISRQSTNPTIRAI